MASLKDYSELSAQIYDAPIERRTINEWKAISLGDDPNGVNNKETGLRMQAYKNGNEIVIAIAGTSVENTTEFYKDFKTDTSFVTGDYDDQFREAVEYANKIYNQIVEENDGRAQDDQIEITVTGHSLGGGIAQILSHTFGFKGVTFEAPGAKRVIEPQVETADSAFSDTYFGDTKEYEDSDYQKHVKSLSPELPKGSHPELVNITEDGSFISSFITGAHIAKMLKTKTNPQINTL